MSLVNITNIIIDNNPAPFQDKFKLHITFECIEDIPEEIDWEFLYVGSAKDESKDIMIDSFSMGPLEKGVMQFTVESNAPDYKLINKDDLLNITAIILSVSYKKQEFFRVGYYTYNQYTDPDLIENDPPEIIIEKVQRNILSDKPRITRFDIEWKPNQNQEGQVLNSDKANIFNNSSSYNDTMFGNNANIQGIKQDFAHNQQNGFNGHNQENSSKLQWGFNEQSYNQNQEFNDDAFKQNSVFQ